MTRKRTAIVLAGVLGVVAATLVLVGVLHGGGTAQADAPPANFTKANVPDLGQHSQNWCWVGAAANSLWWSAHYTTGQDGLLGGVGHPWETTTDPNSLNAGNVCWYDANDMPQQHAPPPPKVVYGYRQLLSMIAQTTFMDKVQDGVRDPDGLDNIPGNADDENNYCYADGVEKWDYLIGLRDYVNNYGSGLKVHDIIDPARCGLHTGLIVNRGAPTTNFRDPCAGVAGPGVPGVDQVVRPPTFADYQNELSASDHDVLLWLEPAPGYYPETAHVVTGVGYKTNPAPNTITISDPWTRNANPPVAPHDDTWNIADPSHNRAYGNLPSPYDTCTVVNPGPAPNFQIHCGATTWIVYDMIFVSPFVVNKQVSDVVLDDGSNDPQPGNELTLLSEEPLARTSNYEYATTDPDFKYFKTQNVKVSVTSLDENLGPDVPDDAYVSFLADVPAGCEGRWIPQTSPDGLHTDILTRADYIADLADPLGQTGGTIIDPQDPLYNEKMDGDGNPHTIESDLHFQTKDWELNEPVGGQLSLLRFFEFDCSQPGDFTFTFYNKIEPEPLDADVDPVLTNNWWKATMLVHSLHNTDVEILSWTAPSPQNLDVGVPFEITADEVKHNAGPQAAWSDVTWTAQEPQGGEVSARWIAEPGDTQPSDEVLKFYINLPLPVSTDVSLSRDLELTCNVAGGPYTVTLINDEWPVNPDPPHESWEDLDPHDNTRTFDVLVNCSLAGQEIKWQQPPDPTALGMDVDATQPFVLADDFQCTESGMITQIDFWASWLYDEPPMMDPSAVGFTLSLHSDVPAGPSYSHPGDLLWVHTFGPGECTPQLSNYGPEGWFEPPQGYVFPADYQMWLYSCTIPASDWFQQAEGTIYWLDIQAMPMPMTSAKFGWKTSIDHWNDDGVWSIGEEPIPSLSWYELRYPPQHQYGGMSIDLAFQIWGQPCAAGVDTDHDGFNDDVECYVTTDHRDACPDVIGGDDAWPLDITMDRTVDVLGDVLAYRGHVGARPGDSNWVKRLDLNMDAVIDVLGDVLMYRGHIGEICT